MSSALGIRSGNRSLRHPPSRVITRFIAGLMSLAVLFATGFPPLPGFAEAQERRKSTIRFFHHDHLGSVTMVTDEAGRVVESVDYKPFGEVSRHEGAHRSPHRFTGQRFDDSTGLYYYKGRYYDAQLGRFTQPDPFVQDPADPQTLNRYAYVRNNPVNLVDPSGHFWFIPLIIAAVKAALVGAALNATVAAFTGGDIGKAALVGAAGGAIFGAGSFIANAAFMGQTLTAAVGRTALMAGTGALAGTTGAAMTGQSLGRGAGVGAVLGFLGAVVPTPSLSWFGQGRFGNFGNPIVNSALKGSVIGAGAAAVQGQHIGRGALGGAAYYGTGALINSTLGATGRGFGTSEDGRSAQPSGMRVFRVWGKNEFGQGAEPWGRSWTTVDPRMVPDYRGAAGLPPQNTGRFISEGILQDTTGVTMRPATYGLTTQPGTSMVPEVVIPNPQEQVDLENVFGANPEY